MPAELKRPDNGITKDQMPVQLPANCMREAEFEFTVWAVMAPNGLPPAALLAPGFWALYAPKLKPFDEVRARAEDGTWMARYVVLEAGRTWARMQQLELHNLGTQDVSITKAAGQAVEEAKKGFDIIHRGPRGWSVVRRADKQVMHEGAQSKGAAATWLDGHLRTTDAGAPQAAAAAPA